MPKSILSRRRFSPCKNLLLCLIVIVMKTMTLIGILHVQNPQADWFVAVGKSEEFPSQWKKGKKDPFFNLTLVGLENSPGQNGSGVTHSGEDVEISKKRFSENNFDILASERIPLDRSIGDKRHPDCLKLQYDEDLPSTSIVIIFYDEAPSVILRTVVSILNRSPLKFVKEIILVDDCSDIAAIEETLPKAIEFLFPPLVKLVRNPRRLGLIKARMAGSDKAQGDVILFLDAHCEVMIGWLEPLLQRIKEDYRYVVMPSHDTINKSSFEIVARPVVHKEGTFNWGLLHKWVALPPEITKQLKTRADPVKSPTMAGGLFAISRKWWEHLGKYDPGFEVWGGENLEISFKTWMCGGRLDIMPCSHVGHVFRSGFPKKGHVRRFMAINQKRLAEVWLDDYKNIVYLRHPELKTLDAGNITDRVNLRHRLNCSSFDWYMKNVHPDKHVPTLKVKAMNGLMTAHNSCVDTMQIDFGPGKIHPLCHYKNSQNYQLTEFDQIRAQLDSCLEGNVNKMNTSAVSCHPGAKTQTWIHSGPQSPIKSALDPTLCLSYENDDVILAKCDPKDIKQQWTFKDYVKL